MNKFKKALDRIKKNVEIQDDWTDEDFEHYETVISALEIASDLYELSTIPIQKKGELYDGV